MKFGIAIILVLAILIGFGIAITQNIKLPLALVTWDVTGEQDYVVMYGSCKTPERWEGLREYVGFSGTKYDEFLTMELPRRKAEYISQGYGSCQIRTDWTKVTFGMYETCLAVGCKECPIGTKKEVQPEGATSYYKCVDSCKGVLCEDKCENSRWFHEGECRLGKCSWIIDDCQFGCTDEKLLAVVNTGMCRSTPCEGVICDDYCSENSLFSDGKCIDGKCTNFKGKPFAEECGSEPWYKNFWIWGGVVIFIMLIVFGIWYLIRMKGGNK